MFDIPNNISCHRAPEWRRSCTTLCLSVMPPHCLCSLHAVLTFWFSKMGFCHKKSPVFALTLSPKNLNYIWSLRSRSRWLPVPELTKGLLCHQTVWQSKTAWISSRSHQTAHVTSSLFYYRNNSVEMLKPPFIL